MKVLFGSIFCLLFTFVLQAGLVFPDRISTVAYPVKASPTEKYAAEELAGHLSKVCGRKINSLPEDHAANRCCFFVGRTSQALRRNIPFSKLGREEWLIQTIPEGLIIAGGAPRGTLFGVYEFLERFAGIAWLDEFYTEIPKKDRISLPDKIDLKGKPVFQYRGQYTYHGEDQTRRFLFRSRNRENIFFEEKLEKSLEQKIGHSPVLGGPAPLNTLYYYISEWPAAGFEDCYSLDEAGKRVRPTGVFGPGQICFSAPRARKKIAEQMIAHIRKDRIRYPEFPPQLYNLSVNDVKDICNCRECAERIRKYGCVSGAMLEFVNSVAETVTKVYPDIRIQTSAYLVYEQPPLRGIQVHPNVTVRLSPSRWGLGFDTMRSLTLPRNKKTLDGLKKWRKLGNIQIWNYWVLFGEAPDKNACIINLEAIKDNLQTFRELGSDYVFSECEYPENTTFHAMRVWIGYKLLWDPQQELAPLIDRFMKGYYGKAAPFMKQYYEYLVKRQSAVPELDTRGVLERNYFDAEFFRTVEDLLQKALKTVSGDPERTRHVLNEQVPFDIARVICMPDIPDFKPDANAVKNRLLTNWTMFSKRYLTGVTRRRSQTQIDTFFKEHAPKKYGCRYPVPETLQGREIYEILHTDFNQYKDLKFLGVRMQDDPEAAGGRAMGVDKSERIADIKGFHAKKICAGVQDRKNKKALLYVNIPKDKIPQDEKYHLYPIGTVELSPSTLLWLHETWYLQQNLSHFYKQGKPDENRYEIYVSLKFCGPAYVKNSKKENAFWMDRILLVRPKKK